VVVLPAPVRPEQTDDLARPDAHRHVLQDLAPPERLVELLGAERRGGHASVCLARDGALAAPICTVAGALGSFGAFGGVAAASASCVPG